MNEKGSGLKQATSVDLLDDNLITIDGPAASGKTSVSRELARRLGWQWVSTGAFYRGLAYVAQEKSVSTHDEKALAKLVDDPDWEVEMTPEKTVVRYLGKDVSEQVASEQVGSIASQISHFPEVRKALLRAQRECRAISVGLVAEGRDCGTVVFPNAGAKFFLTANLDHRAHRRAREQGLSADQLKKDQSARDQQDASRATAPMKIPENAQVIDSTEMSLNEVVDSIQKIAVSRQRK